MVATSHARISVTDTGGPGAVVLLIHGNSACTEIFAHQFESRLTQRYRHVALEVLEHLAVDHFAVLGWSLGGHVGIELLARDVDAAGLAITGTPPIGHNAADFAAG